MDNQIDDTNALIESFANTLREMAVGIYLLLPIRKLKNIEVNVTIHKAETKKYIFNIAPIEFRADEDSLFEEIYDRKTVAPAIAAIMTTEGIFLRHVVRTSLLILKTIKIDKLHGKFCSPMKPPQVQWSTFCEDFCEEFKDNETMDLALKECCVCFALTASRTNCGHSICLECIANLKIEKNETNETFSTYDDYKNCPVCRQRITFLK